MKKKPQNNLGQLFPAAFFTFSLLFLCIFSTLDGHGLHSFRRVSTECAAERKNSSISSLQVAFWKRAVLEFSYNVIAKLRNRKKEAKIAENKKSKFHGRDINFGAGFLRFFH